VQTEVIKKTKAMFYDAKRPVLIICEAVDSANKYFDLIKEAGINNPIKYTSKYTKIKFDISKPHVIVATNLAGRGTDIKISKRLNQRGGLHVIVAMLAQNSRIEAQAFGRAARAGN